MPLTITNVRAIVTRPGTQILIAVKVETSEPGLYGLGCATFSYRPKAVATFVEDHLRPLLLGRDPARIEELYQLMSLNAYWRNGPITNNAISGVDMALWDIKGKLAGMPVYDLLGGKCREGVPVYLHADGAELEEIEDNVARFLENGIRHIRVQWGGYGGATVVRDGTVYAAGWGEPDPAGRHPKGALPGIYFDRRRYREKSLRALGHIRGKFGMQVELLHDVHSRLAPSEALSFAKELEPLGLFFLEDVFAPEDIDWLENLRAVCATPIAIGELFNHPREWIPLITARRLDFLRMHISQMGGLTPARKAAILAEAHGVRTAWHGPADTSPVGHACNIHLDLASPNFGIQEFTPFSEPVQEVFPGCPVLECGFLYVSDRPGWGIDLDEAAAARFVPENEVTRWTEVRLPDGSLGRP